MNLKYVHNSISFLVGVTYSTLCFVLSTEHINHEHNSYNSYKHKKRLTYFFHSVTVHLHNLHYVTLSLQILFDVECAFFPTAFHLENVHLHNSHYVILLVLRASVLFSKNDCR
jgi:hypothetical protein